MTAQIVQLPAPPKPAKQVHHITDALAKRLPAPPAGNKVYFDDTVAGYGVRVTERDARSYVFGYKTRAGRKRMLTIGDIGSWRATAAREAARAHKRIVQQGGDIRWARSKRCATRLPSESYATAFSPSTSAASGRPRPGRTKLCSISTSARLWAR
jgi:hypothetical protein